MAPPPVPEWLVPWSVWVIGGKVGPRPAGAPRLIPSWAVWFPGWVKWRMNGKVGVRPAKAPNPVPPWVWAPASQVIREIRREESLAFWRRMGVWVTRLDHFVPEWLAWEYGGGHYDYVIVPTLRGALPDTGEGQDELDSWVARARAVGVDVVGSQWGMGFAPEMEADAAADEVVARGLDGWCINGEKLYEGGGKSGRYARRFRQRLPFTPLLWSPEPRLDLDHGVLQDLAVAYGPQAYPLENGWNVADVAVWASKFGYAEEDTIPLVQAYTDPAGVRYPAGSYRDQARAFGFPSVILYTGNQCLDDRTYWWELLV